MVAGNPGDGGPPDDDPDDPDDDEEDDVGGVRPVRRIFNRAVASLKTEEAVTKLGVRMRERVGDHFDLEASAHHLFRAALGTGIHLGVIHEARELTGMAPPGAETQLRVAGIGVGGTAGAAAFVNRGARAVEHIGRWAVNPLEAAAGDAIAFPLNVAGDVLFGFPNMGNFAVTSYNAWHNHAAIAINRRRMAENADRSFLIEPGIMTAPREEQVFAISDMERYQAFPWQYRQTFREHMKALESPTAKAIAAAADKFTTPWISTRVNAMADMYNNAEYLKLLGLPTGSIGEAKDAAVTGAKNWFGLGRPRRTRGTRQPARRYNKPATAMVLNAAL